MGQYAYGSLHSLHNCHSLRVGRERERLAAAFAGHSPSVMATVQACGCHQAGP